MALLVTGILHVIYAVTDSLIETSEEDDFLFGFVCQSRAHFSTARGGRVPGAFHACLSPQWHCPVDSYHFSIDASGNGLRYMNRYCGTLDEHATLNNRLHV